MGRVHLVASVKLAPVLLLVACSAATPRAQPGSGGAGGRAGNASPDACAACDATAGSAGSADGPAPSETTPPTSDAPTIEAAPPEPPVDAAAETGAPPCPGLFCED